MRRWTAPTLVAIFLMAVVIRLWPLLSFEIWGSDTGEYVRLTEGLMAEGSLTTVYSGWGIAYPFFQGAEVLIGATALSTGLAMLGLMKVLLPVVGAFSVVIVFLIGRRAFTDERAGLMAAAFVAVAMPHVFATSHAMPGTLGDMLALSCILLFLKAYEDKAALFALFLATIALVATHHLSTFFVLVPILMAVFVREFIRTRTHPVRFPVDMFYLTFLMTTALVYWLVVAVPFRDEVMVEAFGVHPVLVAAIAIGLVLLAGLVVMARRRFLDFRYTPRYPSVSREWGMLIIMVVSISACLLSILVFSVPGTDIKVGPRDLLTVFPIGILSAVAVVGMGPAEFSRRGLFILSWVGAIGIVLVIGTVTRNTVLLPYRQLQYIIVPLGLLAGWGVTYLADALPERRPFAGKARNVVAVSFLAALIVLTGLTAFPSRGLLGGFEEGTVEEEMDGVAWCRVNVPARGTMVATDHRMSSLLFGFAHVNGTWDSAYWTLHGDLEEARDELASVEAPAGAQRIDYVLLTDPMKEGVALVQWENAQPMSKEALDKFGTTPFQRLYDSNGVVLFLVGPV